MFMRNNHYQNNTSNKLLWHNDTESRVWSQIALDKLQLCCLGTPDPNVPQGLSFQILALQKFLHQMGYNWKLNIYAPQKIQTTKGYRKTWRKWVFFPSLWPSISSLHAYQQLLTHLLLIFQKLSVCVAGIMQVYTCMCIHISKF